MLSKRRPSASVSGAVYSTNSKPSVPIGFSNNSIIISSGCSGHAQAPGKQRIKSLLEAKAPRKPVGICYRLGFIWRYADVTGAPYYAVQGATLETTGLAW